MPMKLNKELQAMGSPTSFDIAWAAGIWEGEGYIAQPRKSRPSLGVGVTQKDDWLLWKLRILFGGSVGEFNNPAKCGRWRISGPRAWGFILTIFPYLSPRRRQQVRLALGK
jgi:hypothetical protein